MAAGQFSSQFGLLCGKHVLSTLVLIVIVLILLEMEEQISDDNCQDKSKETDEEAEMEDDVLDEMVCCKTLDELVADE